MKYTALYILSIIIILASCAHHDKYPTSWKPIIYASGDKCPNVSGRFLNEGERAADETTNTNHNYDAVLSVKLLTAAPCDDCKLKKFPSHVTIDQEGDETIKISAWYFDEELYSNSLESQSNHFSCESGFIKINKSEFVLNEIALGGDDTILDLYSADGYLMVKEQYKFSGLMFLFPTLKSEIKWYRFTKVNEKI